MQIVIEIHEKDYQSMKNGHISFSALDALMSGTQLPKGHGRAGKEDPCDDAISRQAVLERLKREEKILYTPTGMNYLINSIKALPSVKPQPKMGRIVLDELKSEIECQKKWLFRAGYTAHNIDIAFDTIKSVLERG